MRGEKEQPFAGRALIGVWVVLAALGGSEPARAAFVERFRNWSLYVHEDPNGKVCFVASVPTRQEGTYRRRDQPRLFVTQFGGKSPRQEVSVDPGYTFRRGSVVEAAVDGVRFELFTDGDRAWARDAAEDQRLIDAMRRGQQMTIRGTSVRDTWSLDTYSLAGFSAAHKAMTEACRDGARH